jgi:hypothetical protein
MLEYHKIDTVFKRDPSTRHKSLIVGDYSNEAFSYLKDNNWVFTEKVDGTNIRVMYADGRISFRGKTDDAQIPAFLIDRLRQKFDMPAQLTKFAEQFPDGSACLYGEGYGAKIQKGGGNYRQDQDFVLFDVKVGPWWLMRDAVVDVAVNLGIETVPVIGVGTLAEMLALAREGFHSRWGDFPAEGIVARPAVELVTRNGARIITKIKHKDFAPS